MDFSQNACVVMKYDGMGDAMSKLGTNPRSSYITVKDGRLRIVQGSQNELLVDSPTGDVQVRPAKKIMPGVASIDIGDNHWLIDFGRVHKWSQRKSGGLGAKLAAGSAFGNFKAIKVAKEIRVQFVSSLGSQGATVET